MIIDVKGDGNYDNIKNDIHINKDSDKNKKVYVNTIKGSHYQLQNLDSNHSYLDKNNPQILSGKEEHYNYKRYTQNYESG